MMDEMAKRWKTLSVDSQEEFRRGFNSAKEDSFCLPRYKEVIENSDFTLGWLAYYVVMREKEIGLAQLSAKQGVAVEKGSTKRIEKKIRDLIAEADIKWPEYQIFSVFLKEIDK